MLCSICFEEIPVIRGWAHGNNASPVNMGRCCNRCDNEVVIPARIRLLGVPHETYDAMLFEQYDEMRKIVNAKLAATN